MADVKITALTAISANPVNPATFPMPMVDLLDTSMAASGSTRKVTVNQILGAGGTATLASATITGDLTVRTNVLKVISTGVGIGTATPNTAYILDLTTAYDARARQWVADTSFLGSGNLANGYQLRTLGASSDGIKISNYANTVEYLRIDSSGNVGVGKTPLARLDVASARAASVVGGIVGTTGTGVVNDECQFLIKNVNTASGQNNGAGIGGLLEASASNKSSLMFYVDNGTAVTNCGRFDSNGNLILQSSATPATLTTNGQLTVNATSNTNLRFSYRGSDGTTRVANITLA
jgi:hypothetical protein